MPLKWVLFSILSSLILYACAAPDNAPGTTVTIRPTVPEAYRAQYPGGNQELTVPAGFRVNVFAAGLSGPRHLALGPDGAIYVAEKAAGRISRMADTNADGVADSVEPYITGLELPNGLEWHTGSLYVGATDGVYKFTPPLGPNARGQKLVDLPPRGGHHTRTVHFAPDGKMYVTIGSTCNVCVETDPRRAAMWVYNADGTNGRLFAKGLRNTVDFAFHPQTGAIFGVDNGRDGLGDDVPPEELNLIRDGGDYGWPVCHGGTLVDPNLGKEGACEGPVAPVLNMQAHSAPLGVAFYTASQFPAAYQGTLFIAFHGSWNRSIPTGYKVVAVPFRDGMPAGPPADFVSGWLAGSRAWGRPVGLMVAGDGSLLVSDDREGVIYRVSYAGH